MSEGYLMKEIFATHDNYSLMRNLPLRKITHTITMWLQCLCGHKHWWGEHLLFTMGERMDVAGQHWAVTPPPGLRLFWLVLLGLSPSPF